MTDKVHDEIFIDTDMCDNRYSLKGKEHRTKYIRAALSPSPLSEDVMEVVEADTTYLVIVCSDTERFGLFSTEERAKQWAADQSPTCVICPYVIDEPDFGNVKDS